MQACDRCHRRKQGCDKRQPCSNCRKANEQCAYSDRTKEKTFRAEHVERLERRLRHAEARNRTLAGELARAKETQTRSQNPTVETPSNVQSDETRPPTAIRSSADVITEVSYLSINAAGERQYLGSASGILFADLVRAGVGLAGTGNSQQAPDTNPSIESTSNTNSHTRVNGDSLPELPNESLARNLVKAYLDHDHLCYPFLLPSYIHEILDRIYTDPAYYVSHPFEAFLFDMILAISTANVYKYDWQMLPSAESHHSRAMGSIAEILRSGGLQSLQALLLLCQYRTGSSIQDTSASMWHLVGIAARICFELGLHQEAAYIQKRPDADSPIETIERYREQEVRRRCFWCVLAMDRIVSIILGRPLAIREDDIDVRLPDKEDDDLFYANFEDFEQENEHERTQIFVHIIKYRLLCGQIMLTLHGKRNPGRSEGVIKGLRDDLVQQLDSWKIQTEGLDLLERDSPLATSRSRSSFRSREWYTLIYHNAMLMLFRPSPALSDISRDPITLQRLFDSSKQSITLYARLHKSRRINYSWVTLQSVFMAGLSYIYAVSRHFRERRRRSSLHQGSVLSHDPGTVEIVNDTRACSNVLVAVSERWNALRHCHEVFDRLSDAVLADSIKIQTTITAVPSGMQARPDIGTQWSPIQPPAAAAVLNSTSNFSPQSSWLGDNPTMTRDAGGMSHSPLAVDNEFRSCFDDLQNLYYQQQVNNPVLQLSQDWLGYLGPYDAPPFEASQHDHPMITDMASILN